MTLARLTREGELATNVAFPGSLPVVCIVDQRTCAVLYNAGDGIQVSWRLSFFDIDRFGKSAEVVLPDSSSGVTRLPRLLAGTVPGTVLVASPSGGSKTAEIVFRQYDAAGVLLTEFRSPDGFDHSDVQMSCTEMEVIVARSFAEFSKSSPASPNWQGLVLRSPATFWKKQN